MTPSWVTRFTCRYAIRNLPSGLKLASCRDDRPVLEGRKGGVVEIREPQLVASVRIHAPVVGTPFRLSRPLIHTIRFPLGE